MKSSLAFQLSHMFLYFLDRIITYDKHILFSMAKLFKIRLPFVLLLLPNLNSIMFLPKAVVCPHPPVLSTLPTDLPTALASHLSPAAGVAGRAANCVVGGGGPTAHVPAGAAHAVPQDDVPLLLAACPLLVTSFLTTSATAAAVARLSQGFTQEM